MKKKKTRLCAALTALVLTAALVLAGCGRDPGPGADPISGSDPVPASPDDAIPASSGESSADVIGREILPGVTVSDPFSYSGPYVEDGSDDEVESIAAVTLTNRGGTDYRYMEFTVQTPSGVLSFSASSVHAGTATTVLNRNRTPYAAGETAVSAECPVSVEYDTPPVLHEELFALKQAPGSFSIENITGGDLPGTVTVYYKSADENGYLGGITFRTVIEGLKAGEEKWNPAGHMGRVVFVTYEE
jgi:predicted small secreted protein